MLQERGFEMFSGWVEIVSKMSAKEREVSSGMLARVCRWVRRSLRAVSVSRRSDVNFWTMVEIARMTSNRSDMVIRLPMGLLGLRGGYGAGWWSCRNTEVVHSIG